MRRLLVFLLKNLKIFALFSVVNCLIFVGLMYPEIKRRVKDHMTYDMVLSQIVDWDHLPDRTLENTLEYFTDRRGRCDMITKPDFNYDAMCQFQYYTGIYDYKTLMVGFKQPQNQGPISYKIVEGWTQM